MNIFRIAAASVALHHCDSLSWSHREERSYAFKNEMPRSISWSGADSRTAYNGIDEHGRERLWFGRPCSVGWTLEAVNSASWSRREAWSEFDEDPIYRRYSMRPVKKDDDGGWLSSDTIPRR